MELRLLLPQPPRAMAGAEVAALAGVVAAQPEEAAAALQRALPATAWLTMCVLRAGCHRRLSPTRLHALLACVASLMHASRRRHRADVAEMLRAAAPAQQREVLEVRVPPAPPRRCAMCTGSQCSSVRPSARPQLLLPRAVDAFNAFRLPRSCSLLPDAAALAELWAVHGQCVCEGGW